MGRFELDFWGQIEGEKTATMTTTKMTTIIEFTTNFIQEHGSASMIKLWESKATQTALKKAIAGTKKIKDPDAPKGNLSAYMFFCKDQRDAVRTDIGDDAKAVTKELGVRWNALKGDHSKGKEKKQWEKYEKQAVDDKKRHQDEMATYVPPTEERLAELKEEKETKKVSKRKTSSKSDKDPLAPKGAKSAYMFFSMDMRAQIKKENPEMPSAEVSVELGVRWKDLKSGTNGAEHRKYEKMAADDKKRFLEEKEKYDATKAEESKAEESKAVDSQETIVDEEEEPEKEPEKEKPAEKEPVKKPASKKKQSGYMLFCTEFRSEVKEDNPEMKSTDVTKKLKEMWTEMDKDEKDEWNTKASA